MATATQIGGKTKLEVFKVDLLNYSFSEKKKLCS